MAESPAGSGGARLGAERPFSPLYCHKWPDGLRPKPPIQIRAHGGHSGVLLMCQKAVIGWLSFAPLLKNVRLRLLARAHLSAGGKFYGRLGGLQQPSDC
jgi:hypothetical protein